MMMVKQISEAEAVFNLYVSYFEIPSFEGIQSFINLLVFDGSLNFEVPFIYVTQNIHLAEIMIFTP
jgi:hypothetical protein